MEYVLRQQVDVKYFRGMKNFMVFVKSDYKDLGVELREGDTDYSDNDKTNRFIKAQIENSIVLGWKPEDIVIATNFNVEYMGVKTHILDEICDYSQFFHKQYAVLELMQKGVLDTNIFYHDLDAFQLEKFEFPKFDGDWGICVYPKELGYDGHSCQCGVMYFKPSSVDIFDELVDGMKRKKFGTHDDEVVIRNFVKLNPKYSHRVSVLNTCWNVGMTGFSARYSTAEKPIYVVHFHPDREKEWDCMIEGKNDFGVKVVDERLMKIFKKYNLQPNNEKYAGIMR